MSLGNSSTTSAAPRDYAHPAWKCVNETTGNLYAVELMRLRIRYVIIVNVPEPNKFFLHSVRILTEETASGAHWFEPDQQTLEFALAGSARNTVR
jgi:hypothetical protein